MICYDRSPDSRVALEHAIELFANERATVLTVSEPFAEVVVRTPIGFAGVPGPPDPRVIDVSSRQGAEAVAAEGAELASGSGMTAKPRIAAQATTIGRTILAEADTLGVAAIVMGSRGRTGIKSRLLGSVVHDVLQHADRVVVVVPSLEVAGSHTRTAREEAAG